jgi:hypothetical protein
MQGAYQDTFDNNIQPDMPVNRKMSEPETEIDLVAISVKRKKEEEKVVN